MSDKARQICFCVFLSIVFCAILILSRQNELTFPYPWNDEARFFLPSWQFSIDWSLKPAILNAKDGIFWVPHGYYILLGTLLRIFGRTIEIARSITQIFTASAVVIAVLSNQRISRSYTTAICTTAVLISPPVLLSANEVRMESVVVLLYSLSVLLACRAHRLAALSCLLVSVLFHPALVIALSFYGIAVCATFLSYRTIQINSRGHFLGIICLALAIAATVLELSFVLFHRTVFQEHMLYQTNRKLGRNLIHLLIRPQGLILIAEACFVMYALSLIRIGARTRRVLLRELLPVMSISLGLSVYGVLGAEFQYDLYCLSFAPATFISVAYRLIQLVRSDTVTSSDATSFA